MSDGQSHQQVLWFHSDGLIRGHRKDQVDRLACDLVEHIRWIAKIQSEQSNHASQGRLVNILAMPEQVTDPGSIGIESDVPGEIDVMQLFQGLDGDIYADDMCDPALHRVRKRFQAFTPGGEIERHVELVAALPIAMS